MSNIPRKISEWHTDGVEEQYLATDAKNLQSSLYYQPTEILEKIWNGKITHIIDRKGWGKSTLTKYIQDNYSSLDLKKPPLVIRSHTASELRPVFNSGKTNTLGDTTAALVTFLKINAYKLIADENVFNGLLDSFSSISPRPTPVRDVDGGGEDNIGALFQMLVQFEGAVKQKALGILEDRLIGSLKANRAKYKGAIFFDELDQHVLDYLGGPDKYRDFIKALNTAIIEFNLFLTNHTGANKERRVICLGLFRKEVMDYYAGGGKILTIKRNSASLAEHYSPAKVVRHRVRIEGMEGDLFSAQTVAFEGRDLPVHKVIDHITLGSIRDYVLFYALAAKYCAADNQVCVNQLSEKLKKEGKLLQEIANNNGHQLADALSLDIPQADELLRRIKKAWTPDFSLRDLRGVVQRHLEQPHANTTSGVSSVIEKLEKHQVISTEDPLEFHPALTLYIKHSTND